MNKVFQKIFKMKQRSAAQLCALVMLLLPLAVVALPSSGHAAFDFSQGLVQCDGVLTPQEKEAGKQECDFKALLAGIQYLIDWMFAIAIPIVILTFAYAGFLFMSNTPSNISKAKEIFRKTVVGFIIMLSAWAIVYTILTTLTRPEEGYTNLLEQ